MSTTHAVTADELWRIAHDGKRHELVRGELRTMSSAGSEHGLIVARVTILVGQFVQSHQLGMVFGAETGFKIGTNPETVRAPDLAFMRPQRLPKAGLPKAFWPGAPDLAVEVVSPGDTVEEVDDKVADWLAAGTEVVWVLKPKRRTVTVCGPGNALLNFADDQELDCGDILPGFHCRVAELFPQ